MRKNILIYVFFVATFMVNVSVYASEFEYFEYRNTNVGVSFDMIKGCSEQTTVNGNKVYTWKNGSGSELIQYFVGKAPEATLEKNMEYDSIKHKFTSDNVKVLAKGTTSYILSSVAKDGNINITCATFFYGNKVSMYFSLPEKSEAKFKESFAKFQNSLKTIK